MNMEDYKKFVDKYYLIGYKWKDNISKIISISNMQFMKFINSVNKIVQTIDVSVAYPHFKIVKLNIYLFPQHIDNYITNIFSNYDSRNIQHNQLILDYINNDINKDKINKISINIIENDTIFTINDDKYNIYSLDDNITINNKHQNNHKNIKIKKLISNFIEKY
jgi:hypothetical protein